jgi:hypothetical protein
LLGRLQSGYERLRQSDPETVWALARRVRRYRARLKRAGITPDEVYLPIHPGRAALFVVRELELVVVGAPLALFGMVNHILPYTSVRALARRMSTDKDHWASNVIYPGLVIFPFFYALQLAAAWWLLPHLWAAVYTVALPYTGYYAILYSDRLRRSWRRTATFLRFLVHREEQTQLAAEGRAIVTQIRELGARLERERETPDPEAFGSTSPRPRPEPGVVPP